MFLITSHRPNDGCRARLRCPLGVALGQVAMRSHRAVTVARAGVASLTSPASLRFLDRHNLPHNHLVTPLLYSQKSLDGTGLVCRVGSCFSESFHLVFDLTSSGRNYPVFDPEFAAHDGASLAPCPPFSSLANWRTATACGCAFSAAPPGCSPLVCFQPSTQRSPWTP